ncbi:hypothetical protein K1T71_005545 [Dendrolimus kikuchii]|uniref:Uncharacterized protein n=1 Tax=Dendrolimus kikuchii TaxID=765133 RepID=A0ACC1D4H7_9NEOP|nr:hypothetical protein K1T71_005545 [Dendrolimus kikuchii]
MRVLLFLFIVLSSSFASQLISSGDIENLFRKLIKNELNEDDRLLLDQVIEILHRDEYASSRLVDYNWETRMTLDCILCRAVFAAAFEGVSSGQTDEEISHIIVTLCTSLGIENNNVCTGAITLNIPIIGYIIRNTPEAAPETFCGLVLQTAGNPNTCPYYDPRFEWQVDLPAPTPPVSSPPPDTTDLTIAILTDAHIDPLYEANGVANCGEPTCCRKGQSPAQSFTYKYKVGEEVIKKSIVKDGEEIKLDLSLAPKIRELRKLSQTGIGPNSRNSAPAGYWGDYRNCDTPIWAFDDVIDRISETHRNVDVVYYIGDTIDHGVWETTYDLINEMNRYLIEKMRKSFGDNTLVIPVIGNHESQPTNQFAPASVTGDKLNTTWLYDALVRKWDFYLTDEAKETLRLRGDFSMLVRPGLRVISLNNNVAYRYNWWLVYDPLDAKRQLDWLVEELYKAEQAGEGVHILAHIPPGVHDLTYTWTREYNRIVNRFSSTIRAEFNGHTHSDEFKIFYNSEGQPVNVAWGGGSATSYTFYNLNYKIATINRETYVPNNIVNYSYNLTEANLTPNRRPHWFQLYDTRNTYALTDLSASSMNDLVNRMVTTHTQLLDIYSAFFFKLSDSRWPRCNDQCKLDNLCKIVVTVLWERQKCDELTNLFYSRK